MNDLHKLYIVLRHEKTETIIFRFRVSKGLSHGPKGRGVDCLGYEIAKQSYYITSSLPMLHLDIYPQTNGGQSHFQRGRLVGQSGL